MPVLRLTGADGERLIALADKLLRVWRGYSDPALGIYAAAGGEPHNTVTPIARMRDGKFELDLALRCNITSTEHPLGVFHPHEELHHIKKENIGLIEVMPSFWAYFSSVAPPTSCAILAKAQLQELASACSTVWLPWVPVQWMVTPATSTLPLQVKV